MDVSTGRTLQNLRQAHGYSKAQIATILSIDESLVDQWEHTANYPDADKLVALAALYKTSLEEIVREEKKAGE